MFNFMKKNSESFRRSFLLVMAYGLAFGLGYIFRWGQVIVNYYISEQKKFVSYQMNMKDLMDLLFIGPIFTILSFLVVKRILDSLPTPNFSENKKQLCYIIFLIAIVCYNYGNMIHVTMNRLNSQIIEEYNTEDFYYSVYFLDEIVGHLLITIGFFVVFVELCFLHTLDLKFKKQLSQEAFAKLLMTKQEVRWNFIFSVGLGIVSAFAYLEGQCAFLFLILNPIISLLLIFYSRRAKVRVKENSLITLFILMTITFAIVVLIWAGLFGVKLYYPFFYQNSEL